MAACGQSQACVRAKFAAAKRRNEVNTQVSEQLTLDLGDQFMGSAYSRPHAL